MWGWLTGVTALVTAVLLTEFCLRDRLPRASLSALCVATGGCAHLAMTVLWPPGAFPAALLAGETVYLAAEARRHGHVTAAACLFLGGDLALLPLCLAGDEIWSYGIFLAAFLLCAVLGAANTERMRSGGLEEKLAAVDERERLMVSLIPCAILVPEILLVACVLLVGGSFNILAGLLASVGFLAVYLLILVIQWEMACRLTLTTLNDAMSRWQRESRDYINTIRSQRHDLNLHLNAISGLLKSGSFEKCQEYVNRMVAEVNAINDIMPVGDPVVGSLLLNMREEARRRGSDITYHITYDMSDTVCNGFECNKIIGNLLQNAIDALDTPENRAQGIDLRIFKRRSNTVIIAENRFTGDKDRIARMFETGWSTKRDHEGIGLAMVLRTVESYGGRVYPFFKGDTIRLVVNIPNRVHLTGEEEEDEYQDLDS